MISKSSLDDIVAIKLSFYDLPLPSDLHLIFFQEQQNNNDDRNYDGRDYGPLNTKELNRLNFGHCQ